MKLVSHQNNKISSQTRLKHGVSARGSEMSEGSTYRLSPVCCAVALTLLGCWMTAAQARDYFDPSLLSGVDKNVDLSQFEEPGGQAAGKYLVDIYMNGNYVETREVEFTRDEKADSLIPALTLKNLSDMGVKTSDVPGLRTLKPDSTLNKPLSAYIQQAFTKFDFSQLRLIISVPQIDMMPDAANTVNPSLWQEGVPAFLLNYNLDGSNNRNDFQGSKQTGQTLYVSLQPGLNLGAWRLRNFSSYSYSQQRNDQYDTAEQATRRVSQSQRQWQSQQTYLQRDIIGLRSQLTMGETSTGYVAGQVLDGFSYRGVNLASDDSMSPGYMSGFAPVISGIANSNATVTVTQNGVVVYQTSVAPGPFRITDLGGNGTGGDLLVTITEADGSKHGFRQPYSSLPVMQRTGQLRYEVAAGQYYLGHGSYMDNRTPGFGLLTAMYGLPRNITVYGGGIAAQNYQSAALGLGFSLWGFGAMSLDATHSRSRPDDENHTLTGESYRARFSKSMLTTGTTVDLTAYRYSTRNYMSFSDVNTTGYRNEDSLPPWLSERRRSTLEVRLNQRLFDHYSVWLSGHRDNYWGSNRVNTTLTAGLGGAVYGVGWGVNYSVDRVRGSGDWPENRQVSVNFNVPLSLFSSRQALSGTSVNYSMTHDNTGRVSNQMSTGGTILDDNSLSWGLSQSQGNQGQGSNGSASLAYSGSNGQANLGYNYSSGYKNVTYGANGGLIIHPYGVTLSKTLGNSTVIVRTPGVSGVKVMSDDVTTDYWGNAVMTSSSAYSRNTINIDPSSLPEGASMGQSNNTVYPTSGAVVVSTFPVRRGQQLLMNLTYNGKPVPFGAIVTLKGDSVSQGGIVGDDGQVYLSGMPEKGTLQVKWGNAANTGCMVPFRLDKPADNPEKGTGWKPMKTLNMTCS